MRTKLLISFIAALLTLPSAAFAYERDGGDAVSDQASDQAVDVAEPTDRATDRETDRETDRPSDELTRRCLEADKVSDRCCAHFADQNPERCRDFICQDTDVLTDRCCLHFAADHPERCRDFICKNSDVVSDRCCLHLADDHPERCRDHEINYRHLFWRLFHAGEWELILRLLHHLQII